MPIALAASMTTGRRAVFSLLLLVLPASAASPIERNGARLFSGAIERLGQQVRAGQRPVVVLDVDNVLVDTRFRTLVAAQRFVAMTGKGRRLRGPNDVGFDGRETARRLGLSWLQRLRFERFWHRTFWAEESLAFDRPIAEMVDFAVAAHAVGAQLLFLTGRNEAVKAPTIAELSAAGLPGVSHASVVCKTPQQKTPAFKRNYLRYLARSGRAVALFVSDAADELAIIARDRPQVPLWHYDFPVQPAHAPALPESVTRIQPTLAP